MLEFAKKFYGSNLKFARLYRGLSMEELGNRIGKSKQIISQYESEEDMQQPSFDVVATISEELKFSISFFYTEKKNKNQEITTYFRALLSSNKKDKISQSKKATVIIEIYKFLEKYIEFPKLNLPTIEETDIEKNDYKKITTTIRKHWGLEDKPISNIINVLEANGFILSSINTNTDDIDAFTHYVQIQNERYFCIVLGNEKESFVRRQFSTAHELAHVILHGTKIDMDMLSREEFRNIEREADKFAAELLLPEESFKKDLVYPTNLKFYEELKKKWKVSIIAMILRALELKCITQNQFQYLLKQAYAKGYRTKEPLDDTIKFQEPSLIKLATNMILDNNKCTPEEFMKNLNENGVWLEADEIEEIIGLEPGKLKTEEIYRENDNLIKIDFKNVKKKKN